MLKRNKCLLKNGQHWIYQSVLSVLFDSAYLCVRHSVRKLSGTRSLTVPRCKCEKAGTRNPMQGGRSIFVIGASIASPPGVCLSILPVLQDGSSREEAKISGAAQIENCPCLRAYPWFNSLNTVKFFHFLKKGILQAGFLFMSFT